MNEQRSGIGLLSRFYYSPLMYISVFVVCIYVLYAAPDVIGHAVRESKGFPVYVEQAFGPVWEAYVSVMTFGIALCFALISLVLSVKNNISSGAKRLMFNVSIGLLVLATLIAVYVNSAYIYNA